MSYTLEQIAQKICLAQDYTFIEKVGEGSFKETFHVKNKMEQSGALKVFKNCNSNDRLQREIEALIKCTHPNIGKLYYVSEFPLEDSSYLYTIEEYLPGGTLTRKIKHGSLDKADILKLGEQLISAIKHIASHKLVHRDLKPDNIMFRSDGQTPVIVDFGLVRNLNDTSLTHTFFMRGPGSPYYAAPEQLNNEKHLIDWRTDQFALGIVLSICITGDHPYKQEQCNPGDVIERVAQRRELNSGCVKQLTDLGFDPIIKMISQWPISRYRTPEELYTAWTNISKG